MATFTEDVTIEGNLVITGELSGATRASIEEETLQTYELPLQTWRIHDNFSVPLPGFTEPKFFVSFTWDPNSVDDTFFVVPAACKVTNIAVRIEVAGTDGGAVTAVIKKASTGTDITAGTALHSGTINLKGTVDSTGQVITLSTTLTDIQLAAGDSIGIDFTGTLTSARGTVTVSLTAASPDDLLINTGTFGSNLPYITSENLNASGSLTGYARTLFTLPPEYREGTNLTLRAAGGMIAAVAATSAVVDFEVYKSNRDITKTGSDLVATAATSINSLTFGNKDFTVTGVGLSPGDVLDIRMAIVTVSATASTHLAAVAHTEMLLTIRG